MKDNSNFDRSMTIDVMRMNHDYSSEGSCNTILNKIKKPNIDLASFLKLLCFSIVNGC